MSLPSSLQPNLRRLVLTVVILTALIILATAVHASYQVQKQMLMDNALESNHAYAAKLAETAAGFLDAAQQQLAYSAGVLSEGLDDEDLLLQESERLRLQTDSFNAIGVVDAQGIIRTTAPLQLHLTGQRDQSSGGRQALHSRRPLISAPHLSPAGNLIIFLSHPIFAPTGAYLGYVGGAIYLKQKNILNTLLGRHYYRDGSYIYVVDQTRHLLYHPDPARLGTTVGENKIIDSVLGGGTGSGLARNSQGRDMLAGYAPVPAAGWGIVAQRPLQATLLPLNSLMMDVLGHTAPMALFTLLAFSALAYFIARPLSLLARHARHMDAAPAAARIQKIRSWYFEAAELKRAMLAGIALLQQKLGAAHLDAQTDPLTGLRNRRGLAQMLDELKALQRPFSIIALDIDHFKQVNDTHGHDMGDRVLKKVASAMQDNARPDDYLYRNGGEEFILLLPNTDIDTAARIAERLRRRIGSEDMPHGGRITISQGISYWPADGAEITSVLTQADQALYRSKQAGRNRVELATG